MFDPLAGLFVFPFKFYEGCHFVGNAIPTTSSDFHLLKPSLLYASMTRDGTFIGSFKNDAGRKITIMGSGIIAEDDGSKARCAKTSISYENGRYDRSENITILPGERFLFGARGCKKGPYAAVFGLKISIPYKTADSLGSILENETGRIRGAYE
jgi:hypothetical protein